MKRIPPAIIWLQFIECSPMNEASPTVNTHLDWSYARVRAYRNSFQQRIREYIDTAAIPVNTQADLTFVISNNGTEDLRNVEIECTGDDGLTVLSGNGTLRSVGAGDSVTIQGLRVVGTTAGDHMLHIAAVDRDGDTWSADFTVTIE